MNKPTIHPIRQAPTRNWIPLSLALLLAGMAGLGGDAAYAQAGGDGAGPNYEEFSLSEAQEKAFKKQDIEISKILRAGRFADAQEKKKFDDFYTQYFLARWTTPKYLADLHNFRVKDLRNDFRTARSGEVHGHLNALVLSFMKKLAAGNYRMPVRVNAMLAIGELNSVEQTSPSSTPVPLPEALSTLLDAVNSSKLPDAIRASAMVGVLRHAEAGIQDGEARRSVVDAMLKILSQNPPTGSNAAGRRWIVAQAAETLGFLGSVGNGDANFKALLKTASEPKLPMSCRAIAVEALGRLNYSSAGKIDAARTAAVLGQFALDVCADELRCCEKTGSNVSRARAKQRLEAVLMALEGSDRNDHKGILSLAKDAQRPWIAQLQKTLQDASEALDDKRIEDDKVKPIVEKLQQSIEAWLGKKPA